MHLNDKNIAIIPAKGTSTRLPNKNIRRFFEHPAIAYTIAAARNSQIFERVIVSTDDPLTGDIAEWYGAEYLQRPPHLATHSASLVDVALHMLESTGTAQEYDHLCQLMPNCPLRNSHNIREHYEWFISGQRRFQISTVPYRGVYPHWALTADEDGEGQWLFGDQFLVNSQELGTAVCPTGAIWWVRIEDFLEQRSFYGRPFHLAWLDGNRGMDIDREEEYELLDLIVRGLQARDGETPLEDPARAPFPESLAEQKR